MVGGVTRRTFIAKTLLREKSLWKRGKLAFTVASHKRHPGLVEVMLERKPHALQTRVSRRSLEPGETIRDGPGVHPHVFFVVVRTFQKGRDEDGVLVHGPACLAQAALDLPLRG